MEDKKNSNTKEINKTNKKKIIIAISTIIVLLLLIGSSYAIWNYYYNGENKNVIGSENISLEFLESTDVINIPNAIPISDDQGKLEDSFDFEVTTKTKNSMAISYDLYIEKLSVETGYTQFQDNEIKVYLTDYNNKTLVEPKLISDLDDYVLYTKTNSHSKTNEIIKNKYKLRAWIDGAVTGEDWTPETKIAYSFKIGVKAQKLLDKSGANKPELSANMIAVYYDETCDNNDGCWRKADSTNTNEAYQWYNYDEKMWANSVTVNATSTATTLTLDDNSTESCSGDTCVRSDYVNAKLGTKIPMDDILTMQVWVPRYKYKVWNYNLDGTKTSNPQEIEITFEQGPAKTGEITCTDNVQGTSDGTPTGTEPTVSEICKINNEECTDDTCNNKTYTHPAFTFGDKELKGIWVGKFEVSSDITCTVTDYAAVNQEGTCNVDTIRPLVKPNITSWRGAMVSVFSNNMMAMNDSNNKYGFSSTDDTHMIKNMEWGAVAYLSHSKYGKNSEIARNSNSKYTTGCGLQAEGSTDPDSICNAYNTSLGKSASTTGNIYGIYDMSGGSYEYVMGNIVSPDGTTMMSGSRDNTSYPNRNSGYDGILYYNGTTSAGYGTYDGTYSYPDNKYIDKYSFTTSGVKSISKLGDGIREVLNNSSSGWYSDYSQLAYSSDPWFGRGGSNVNISAAGSFYSTNDFGNAYRYYSSHLVILPHQSKLQTAVYSWSTESVALGASKDSISGHTTDYTTLGKNYFLKHNIGSDNTVISNELCYILNETKYCLKGCSKYNSEEDICEITNFEENSAILLASFGEENCTIGSEKVDGYSSDLEVSVFDKEGIYAFGSGIDECMIVNGSAYCIG